MSTKKKAATKVAPIEVSEVKVGRGRPVSTDSARQARLAKFEALRASGVVVKRGRPSDPLKAEKIAAAKAAKVLAKTEKAIAKAAAKPVKVKAPKTAKVKAVKTAKVKAPKATAVDFAVELTDEDIIMMNSENDVTIANGFETVDPQE